MRRLEPSPHDKFWKHFINEDACLEIIFRLTYSNVKVCPNHKCGKPFSYSRKERDKQYQCAWCGYSISPLTKTILAETKSSLAVWFRVMLEMVTATNGIAPGTIRERFNPKPTLGTLKGIMNKVRMGMQPLLPTRLRGVVHIDETFVGGRKKLVPGTKHKGIGDKAIVFGMRDDYGNTVMMLIPDKTAETLQPIIRHYIGPGSVIYHDKNASYGDLEAMGYKPRLVKAKTHKSFCGPKGINNNTIEGMWSRFKRFLFGTHVHISHEFLTGSCHEFALHQGMTGLLCKESPLLMVLSIIAGRILTAGDPVVKDVYRILKIKLTVPSEDVLVQDLARREERLEEKYKQIARARRDSLHEAVDSADDVP